MKAQLTLYTRADCCLCLEMKMVIRRVAEGIPLDLHEIDVDTSDELRERFGEQVPVLFVNGRKAFKYSVKASELKRQLLRKEGFGRRLMRKAFSRS
jgi:glutaredoxin